jgi:ATP-dependent DNA helicase RecG
MSEEQELSALLRKMESAHLDHLPPGSSLIDVAQATCAFLNTGGGTIIVESAADRATDLAHKIEEELRKALHPPALWSVTPIERRGSGYCVVDVPAGRDRPYTVGGSIFVRRKTATETASPTEIRGLVENSYTGTERWERRLIPGAGLEQLDNDLVFLTAEEAKRSRNYTFTEMGRVDSVLSDLGLYRERAITNAAEVLFGRAPTLQFPQARVRVTVYATDKTGGQFVDNRQFEGPASRMLEEVFAMIRQHTSVSASFDRGLQRVDRPAYPEAALREGLVNAFVHRDYASFSGGLAVDLYPNRLVIWNTGKLPEGLKIGDLKREHPSMPRNPDIAQVFFLRGFMERVGRGTQKITSECKEAGLPPPEWKVDDTGVTLIFRGKGETVTPTLNRRAKKLLDELAPGERIRLPEYCDRMAVSERQGRRDLANLLDGEWLSREGDGPTTVFIRTAKPWNPAKPGQTRPN